MHPILFHFPDWLPLIGGKAIHTYGALVALGFFLGLSWIKYESKRVGINVNKMVDLFFYIVLSGMIGSRVMYVLISVPEWWRDPLVFIRFWEGGLVFYGGFILATITIIYFSKKMGHSFFEIADVIIPGLALGHSIGRLGCFAAGCCYGKAADAHAFFSVTFPKLENSIAPFDHAVYPTQLFEFGAEFIIFLILIFFRKVKKFTGEIFLLYITVYPLVRSIIEIYRGDKIRGFVIDGVLSTSQFISLIWALIALFLWIKIRSTKQKLEV